MGANDSHSIGESIRQKLRFTKFADHVTDKAWEYVWMDGLRLEVAKYLNLQANNVVLDIGCGDGWFSIQNALRYPEVRFLGVDLFEAREAEEISRLVGAMNCTFYEMDALNMKIEERIDHVVFYMSLGNICRNTSDLQKLFRNCWKVMKKGGKLLIVEPFEEDFPEQVREKVKDLYKLYKKLGKSRGEDKETILSRAVTLKILVSIGFKILKVMWKKFNWYMNEKEVKEYFEFEKLPFRITDKFWVFDKPKQVTIIVAMK